MEDENGMYKNNMKEIHHRMCTEREAKVRKVKRQVLSTPPTTTPDLMAWFDPSWFFPEDHEGTDEDDELPGN